ncbi:ATPase, T2SS/T4P/T4SS family [Clostridium hydrogeniformans]|uniref:ATPase, T2SS/T4P/T4SS family n=1 Tax=Clostridium hydrogeniformans TaxID=349933 RepID=UPI00048290CA|nr:ATPase, T2SS/T4P/T4SS family [Clostridium hydrogeniformans]
MGDIKFLNLNSVREKKKLNRTETLASLVDEIIVYLTRERGALAQDIQSGKLLESALESEIIDYIDKEEISLVGYTREDLIKNINNYLYSYYVYQDLLDSSDVQEVRLISRNLTKIVYINSKGKVKHYFDSSEKFENRESYNAFVEYIASRNGRELNQATAQVQVTDKFRCKDSILRITITNKEIDGKGNANVLFAKTPRRKKTYDKLISLCMLNKEMKKYYIENLHSGINMMFIGRGGAGKTNHINALIEEIQEDIDTLIIQRDPELHSEKNNIYFEDIHDEMSGGSLVDLTRAAMKQRIKTFVIGELEGEETFYFLNAGLSGHQVITSMHIDDPKKMITKATQYAQYAKANLSEETYKQIFSTMTCVIYMNDYKCLETVEIEYDHEKGDVVYYPIFEYNVDEEKFIRTGESCETVKRKKKYYNMKNNG